MMKQIRVLVADRHPSVRKGICEILRREADIRVVAEAGDNAEVVATLRSKRPDVVLLDHSLFRRNGFRSVERILSMNGHRPAIVIMSLYDKEAYVYQAFMAGATGYVVKPALTPCVMAAIRNVANGRFYVSPRMRTEFIIELMRRLDRETGIESSPEPGEKPVDFPKITPSQGAGRGNHIQ